MRLEIVMNVLAVTEVEKKTHRAHAERINIILTTNQHRYRMAFPTKNRYVPEVRLTAAVPVTTKLTYQKTPKHVPSKWPNAKLTIYSCQKT